MNEHNRKSLASFFVLGSQWCLTLCLLVTIILTSVSVYKVSILIVWEPALVEYIHSVSFHELHYSILATQKLDSHSGFFINVRGSSSSTYLLMSSVAMKSQAVFRQSHRFSYLDTVASAALRWPSLVNTGKHLRSLPVSLTSYSQTHIPQV